MNELIENNLIEKILTYLTLNERLLLRSVCKNFCHIIDNYPIKRLFISENEKNQVFNQYFKAAGYNDNFIEINLSQFYSINQTAKIKFNLTNLNCLTIYGINVSEENNIEKVINLFKDNLVKLNLLFSPDLIVSIELVLLKLKFLNIRWFGINSSDSNSPNLLLDCPNLIKFSKCEKTKYNLKLLNKINSIRQIELGNLDPILENYEFNKLEYLYIKNLDKVNENFFANFKGLKELHFKRKSNSFKYLYYQKLLFGLCNLDIYFNGLLIDNLDEFNSLFGDYYVIRNDNLINKFIDNQSKLSKKLTFYRNLDFSIIENQWFKLDRTIWLKMINLNQIIISKKVDDLDNFFKFLKIFSKNIFSLQFKNELQSTELLKRLPDYCPLIQELIFFKGPSRMNNLNFILGFKNLIALHICDFEKDKINVLKKRSKLSIFRTFNLQKN